MWKIKIFRITDEAEGKKLQFENDKKFFKVKHVFVS